MIGERFSLKDTANFKDLSLAIDKTYNRFQANSRNYYWRQNFAFKGKKKGKKKIVEGSSVYVDGQQYILYQIVDDEDEEKLRAAGIRRVNGGGIAWRDAKLECKKRGKHLAMIFTNEAATALANAMLKSRPCNYQALFIIC